LFVRHVQLLYTFGKVRQLLTEESLEYTQGKLCCILYTLDGSNNTFGSASQWVYSVHIVP